MISFLCRKLIPDAENVTAPSVRRAYGTLCSVVGIVLNVLLFAAKFIAGRLAASVAVTADAFNNLSDAGASVVTLLGFKLAGQKPDPEHPFGHGRMEYLSGLVVSFVILLLGVELLRDAVDKILHPAPVESGTLTVVILAASIAVKLYMFLYNRAIGKKISSASMYATATDSLSDCIATLAVLIATLVGQFAGLMIDGYCGFAVACFVFWAGIRAAKETLAPLLGQPPEKEFVREIAEIVTASPTVCGIHDLVVHDYGPGRVMITLHAEVPGHGDMMKVHDEIDNLEKTLRRRLGCEATIHMDPIVTDDALTEKTHRSVASAVKRIDERITIHDFRMVQGPTHTNVIFDAVVPYDSVLTEAEAAEKIRSAVREMDESWFAVVQIDRPYT